MRLPPLSEHIEFPGREQRFCENVLLARGLGGLRQIGGGGISKSQESTETLQNNTLFDRFTIKGLYL